MWRVLGETPRDERVRTAELIGALGLATDLGMGFPFEHGFHETLIAMRLAERLRDLASPSGADISSEMSLARSCTVRSISANGDGAALVGARPRAHRSAPSSAQLPSEPGATSTGSGAGTDGRGRRRGGPGRAEPRTAPTSGFTTGAGSGAASRAARASRPRSGTNTGVDATTAPGADAVKSCASADPSSARCRGARGARLITGTSRPASTPWPSRSPKHPELRVEAGHPGHPDHQHEVGGRQRLPGEDVAVLDVAGPALLLALDVRVDVDHDVPVRGP